MTNLDVLLQVIQDLDRIQVPTGLVESVTIPIYNANSKLKALYQTISESIEKEEDKTNETEQSDVRHPEVCGTDSAAGAGDSVLCTGEDLGASVPE